MESRSSLGHSSHWPHALPLHSFLSHAARGAAGHRLRPSPASSWLLAQTCRGLTMCSSRRPPAPRSGSLGPSALGAAEHGVRKPMEKFKVALVAVVLALSYLIALQHFLLGVGPTPYAPQAVAGVAFLSWQGLLVGAASAALVVVAFLFRVHISPLVALLLAVPAALPHAALFASATAIAGAAGRVTLLYTAFMLIIVGGMPPLLFWLSDKRFQARRPRAARAGKKG